VLGSLYAVGDEGDPYPLDGASTFCIAKYLLGSGIGMDQVLNLAVGSVTKSATGTYAEAIGALAASASRTSRRLAYCMDGADTDFLSDFGPVVGRRFAEEIAALLFGRLDPLRLIVSMKGARSGDFATGRLNQSSMSWADDVIPVFEPSHTSGSWGQQTLKKNGVVRGLLSGQLACSIFESGFLPALDAIQAKVTTDEVPDWARDLQKFSEGEHLLADLRRRSSQAYSHLSKGIHFEFMPVAGSAIEPAEIKRLLADMLYSLATVALVVNFSGVAHGRLEADECCDIYLSASNQISSWG
jgi:hypothetical protein